MLQHIVAQDTEALNTLRHTATRCNTLPDTATQCNMLQHIVAQDTAAHLTHYGSLQCTATECTAVHRSALQCKTLQHTATHCNTLRHTATHCNTPSVKVGSKNTLQHTVTHCDTPQHTATHCNTLQHNAPHQELASGPKTHCNPLQPLQLIATYCSPGIRVRSKNTINPDNLFLFIVVHEPAIFKGIQGNCQRILLFPLETGECNVKCHEPNIIPRTLDWGVHILVYVFVTLPVPFYEPCLRVYILMYVHMYK